MSCRGNLKASEPGAVFIKAIIWTKYGSPDGLNLQEVEKPVPKDDEILIKVHTTTVTAVDCEMRRLERHKSCA